MQLAEKVNKRFSELYLMVRSLPIAQLLYDGFLTEEEKLAIPFDRQSQNELVSLCATSRRQTPERVLLEMAAEAKLLHGGEYERYRREIGEPLGSDANVEVGQSCQVEDLNPIWDRSEGKLFFQGQAIREVRVCKTRSRLQVIVEAFQNAGWAKCIHEPFNGDLPESQVRGTVTELNRDLVAIRFHVQAGGTEIRWERETHSSSV